jgi:hypothetical protein
MLVVVVVPRAVTALQMFDVRRLRLVRDDDQVNHFRGDFDRLEAAMQDRQCAARPYFCSALVQTLWTRSLGPPARSPSLTLAGG